MEIVIASPGMKFGPETLGHKSLGGSETAALSLAKALKVKGHMVTVFCNLPEPGQPDYIQSGTIGDDDVRYLSLDGYQPFITTTEVDLLIASRSAELLHLNHQARYAVLWTHDLATIKGTMPILQGSGWNFNEIWCVSDWHRRQYAEVTGYPIDFIKVLPNGVNEYPTGVIPRDPNTLLYAARPERGLEAMVRPGGIMDYLGGGWKLEVCMYDNRPPHMESYYAWLFSMCEQNPRVKFIGSLRQDQLRDRMNSVGAYVYPTAFEETSCIMAQEAMSVGTPFVTTREGALPETLGGYGNFYDGTAGWNSDEFCKEFARLISESVFGDSTAAQPPHHRLWIEVAGLVEGLFGNLSSAPQQLFSRLWGMVETSDVIPAISLWQHTEDKERHPWCQRLMSRVEMLYPYLFGRETFAEYYERYFLNEDAKGARVRRSQVGSQRFEQIASEIAKLPAGASVMDYGCAEGVIILDLAARFPDKSFMGVDFAQSNVELCRKYALEMGLTNALFCVGNTESFLPKPQNVYDAVICTEVLEHCIKPWQVISILEDNIRIGGRVIITVPMGNWEAIGLYSRVQYWWRAHIWSIDKWMLREMFADKEGARMLALPQGATHEGRSLGHLLFCYDADHKPVHPIKAMDKAARLRSVQTATACIITNQYESLAKTLNSLSRNVPCIKVCIQPSECYVIICTILEDYKIANPWVDLEYSLAPHIRVDQYGFDDARNDSIKGVETDWVLWIDSDEYLSGDLPRYLRPNAFDAYSIHQHHFTVDPRGTPAMLDKPARLFRTDREFKFYGKVHEHAEKGVNGGPGFCMILADVDIGHTGYVNESVRRARFDRNFPLLEWDHRVNPERRLGKFLWLRDILHRMRYAIDNRSPSNARLLAEEAVSYYKEHWQGDMIPGMGGENAYHYYSEAIQYLGRGESIALSFKMDGDVIDVSGAFESADDLADAVRSAAKGRFAKLASKYIR